MRCDALRGVAVRGGEVRRAESRYIARVEHSGKRCVAFYIRVCARGYESVRRSIFPYLRASLGISRDANANARSVSVQRSLSRQRNK